MSFQLLLEDLLICLQMKQHLQTHSVNVPQCGTKFLVTGGKVCFRELKYLIERVTFLPLCGFPLLFCFEIKIFKVHNFFVKNNQYLSK